MKIEWDVEQTLGCVLAVVAYSVVFLGVLGRFLVQEGWKHLLIFWLIRELFYR